MHRDRLVEVFNENTWHALGQGRMLLEQRTFDVAAGVAQTTQTVIDTDGRDSRTYSVRVYTATELLAMVARAGFAEARAYGGFEGEPLTTTSRLVIVATGSAQGALGRASVEFLHVEREKLDARRT